MHGQRFCESAEPLVWATAQLMVAALFKAGHHTVIVNATNITAKRRSVWVDKFHPDVDIEYKVIDTDPETCIQRAINTGQEDLIPVIRRMAESWDISTISWSSVV